MKIIVSISIHGSELRVAELAVGRKAVSVRRLFSICADKTLIPGMEVWDARGLASVLSSEFSERGITAKRVVFTIGSSGIMLRRIFLPIMKEALVRVTVRTNAKDYFPVGLSEYALACFMSELRKGQKNFYVTAAAAPEKQIRFCHEAAERAGLRLENVCFEAGSLASFFTDRAEKALLIVYLEKDHVTLFVTEKGVPAILRYTELPEDVQQRSRVAGGVVDSVLSMMLCWEDGGKVTPPEAVCILGRKEQAEIWEREMGGRLSVPVYRCGIEEFVTEKDRKQLSPDILEDYAVPIGAALTSVSFVTESEERRMYREKRSRIYRTGILLGILFSVLMVTFPALEYFRAGMGRMDLESRLMLSDPAVPVLEKYEAACEKWEDALLLLDASKTDGDIMSALLEDFELMCPENVQITEFGFQENEVRLSAVAPGKEEAAEFIRIVREIPEVEEIELRSLYDDYSVDNKGVQFSLICGLQEGQEENE